MNEKLVSTLMVNYNHGDTIKEAIQSVLDQTYSNIQLIIIDDGSTDDSIKIIKTFRDPRIELYQMDKNRHICEATNYGLTKVRGDYLARIDSDDVWKKNRLERQLDYMSKHKECRICFTWTDLIDEAGNIINEKDKELMNLYEAKYETQKEWLRIFFYMGNCLNQTSVLMERELMSQIGKFDLGYMQAHDFDYWVRAAKMCSCMHIIQERLVLVRRYNAENVNNSSRTIESNTRFFNEYANIRKHFFEDMSDKLFISTFREDFRNKEALTKEELECEKAFLLCTPINTTCSIPVAGVEALMKIINDDSTKEVLEKKYSFTVKDFYKISCNHVYCDAYLEKAIKEIALKNAELDNLLNIINDYESSTSWKITRPLRKIGDFFRNKR